MKRHFSRFLFLFLFLLVTSEACAAVEARCTELGANCVCSEPFLMGAGGFTQVVDQAFWNPTDTTGSDKECGYEVARHPISRNTQDVQRRTDATALARIGNRITGFVSQGSGADGISFIGADVTWQALGATYNARASTRYYIYHDPLYNFIGDSPQCHSKLLQGNVGSWHLENWTGEQHFYDFAQANWGTSTGSFFPRDCCNSSPGAAYIMQKADWRGHWIRIEAVMTNRGTAGWRTIVYFKDVTTTGVTLINGGNEFVALDTYGTDTGIDPWLNTFNQQIISNPRQLPMVANMYRENGIGTCAAWRGVSHFMTAGWDTDAGQRIGAASEMEAGGGGGGGSTPAGSMDVYFKNLPHYLIAAQ